MRALVQPGWAAARPAVRLATRRMSRIGRQPVKLPEGTSASIEEVVPPMGDLLSYPVSKRLWKARPQPNLHDFGTCAQVTVTGPKGTSSVKLHSIVQVDQQDDRLVVSPRCGGESTCGKVMWGTSRALISNMVTGVTRGYTKELELVGVGFRAALQGDRLVCKLGFSHDVVYEIPERFRGSASIEVPNLTSVVVTGVDKQAVHEVAAQIRDLRRPEPYKGKGIRYAGESIKLKAGKKK
mmetsp:Transcript_1188/g.2781  ORF Transcript_1188/g.2781 Transcript_1188/m.2781 type:complete len:238 (-) Transcript_1188:269-982(-)